ncbi:MAG: RpiB/LacA/LacB family sugar-phosphate isomerase [Patescibacteria group bacterium]
MMIYIGADHKGYKLKEKIAKWLYEMEYEFTDLGAVNYDPTDDYVKYAQEVASLIADSKEALGVLICGSGVGVEVVANKFDGVRASVGKSVLQVKAGRIDDNMNILALAADFTIEKEAKAMLIAFLESRFSAKDRYKRRLDDITKIEANN